MTTPLAILETVLYAEDLDAAERFYREVLGLPLVARNDRLFRFFRVGGAMLLLFHPETARASRDVPAHGARGPGHVCFAVPERELELWRRRLAEHRVAIEHEHRWPNGGRSLYVRDPAGNSVEFASPRIWGLPDPHPAPSPSHPQQPTPD